LDVSHTDQTDNNRSPKFNVSHRHAETGRRRASRAGRRRDDATMGRNLFDLGSDWMPAMLRIESPLSSVEEKIFSSVMDCAFAVHRELGPGFREKIYDSAFCLELDSRGIKFEREKKIDVRYKSWSIPGQRVDLIVEGIVLVEIKAVSKILKVHEGQVRT
jgi:GxxExxY protein